VRCLNCGIKGIALDQKTCTGCGVYIPSLLLGTLPHGTPLDSGKYYIDYPIGKGGFGITYQARHDRLEKLYAIKEFCPTNAARMNDTGAITTPTANQESFNRAQKRFLEEAKVLSNLSHPNIVRVTDFFKERNTSYMVMELIEGQSLKDELKAQPGGKLTPQRVAALMAPLVDAIATIHKNGIYHLDIKPDNAIVTPEGKIVLVDFGSSRQRQYSNTTRTFSESYAPLELMDENGKIGSYSDIFELGMMLHELLAGKLPASAMQRVLRQDLEASVVANDIPVEWARGIKAAIALKPEDRPSSVEDWWQGIVGTKLPTFEFQTAQVRMNGTKVEIIRSQGTAAYYTEAVGDVPLVMVAIPGGTFNMGSDADSDEKPIHSVSVPPFYMSKYPITQSLYEKVMGKNPAKFPGKNRPIESVSWYDAIEFCQKLSATTKKEYRLPTEAEWEYACRAGTTTPFYFGETITPDLVNYDGNYPYGSTPKGIYRQETTEVGNFPANAFGLYDMHGNVWEWCLDEYVDTYEGAPVDGSVRGNIDSTSVPRVLRGGSWSDYAILCRSAIRCRYAPGYRINVFGFRVVSPC
jgi:formylglycine-generating enzyme required for sulfatase activity/predicted Ser/Thr protein kinase